MSEDQQPQQQNRWGDPISEERQAALQAYLDRWAAEADHGERKGPFDREPGEAGVPLTGADASWLADQSMRDALGFSPNLHLEGANLRAAHLEEAALYGAYLERADLYQAHLERAYLQYAHLDGERSKKMRWHGCCTSC
jgi:Pentapeptide repeats (8 copies)